MNLRYLNRILIFLILIPLISCEKSENVQSKLHRVTKVIDGDTIIINGYEKVRLIGIDTPELYSSDKLRRDSFRSGKTVRTIMALGGVCSRSSRARVTRPSLALSASSSSRWGPSTTPIFASGQRLHQACTTLTSCDACRCHSLISGCFAGERQSRPCEQAQAGPAGHQQGTTRRPSSA